MSTPIDMLFDILKYCKQQKSRRCGIHIGWVRAGRLGLFGGGDMKKEDFIGIAAITLSSIIVLFLFLLSIS
ncbi:hypothetical protein [Saezia sanguinis]|uniref:hypothetical protein n=1 Tax=Saezia sanguinis TaxID=1965230 RepID=UPI0030DDB758